MAAGAAAPGPRTPQSCVKHVSFAYAARGVCRFRGSVENTHGERHHGRTTQLAPRRSVLLFSPPCSHIDSTFFCRDAHIWPLAARSPLLRVAVSVSSHGAIPSAARSVDPDSSLVPSPASCWMLLAQAGVICCRFSGPCPSCLFSVSAPGAPFRWPLCRRRGPVPKLARQNAGSGTAVQRSCRRNDHGSAAPSLFAFGRSGVCVA